MTERELQKYDDDLMAEFAELENARKEARANEAEVPVRASGFESFKATVSDDLDAMRKQAELEGKQEFDELLKTARLRDVLDDIKTQRDPIAYLAAAQASKE